MADRAGLENRCGSNITEGSNPSLSACVNEGYLPMKRVIFVCVENSNGSSTARSSTPR